MIRFFWRNASLATDEVENFFLTQMLENLDSSRFTEYRKPQTYRGNINLQNF